MAGTLTDSELAEKARVLEAFPLGELPSEVILHLVMHSDMSVQDLIHLCSVNQRFHEICEDGRIWEKLYIERSIAEKSLPDIETARRLYQNTPQYENWNNAKRKMPKHFLRYLAFALSEDGHFPYFIKETPLGRLTVVSMHGAAVVDDDDYDLLIVHNGVRNLSTPEIPRSLQKIFDVAAGGSAFDADVGHNVIHMDFVPYLYYLLIDNGWDVTKRQPGGDGARKKPLLECKVCESNASVSGLVCGKCKTIAFCSSACVESFLADGEAVMEHDAHCFKADCKEPAYLAKHLSHLLKDMEQEHTEEELSDMMRLHAAMVAPDPLAAEVADAHAFIGLFAKRSGQKSKRAARRGNNKRAASKRTAMRKASRSQSRSKSKEKRAQSRSKSKEKKNARAAQRSGSKSKRAAASRENKKREASKKNAMRKASRSRSRSKSKEKKPVAQPRSKSKEKKQQPNQRGRSKSKSKEKKKPSRSKSRSRSRSRSRDDEDAPAAKEQSRSKGGSLFSSRTNKTDNRSFKGPTFNFGGRGNTTTTTPSLPTIPNTGGGGGAPTVVVVPAPAPAPARPDSSNSSNSDDDSDQSPPPEEVKYNIRLVQTANGLHAVWRK